MPWTRWDELPRPHLDAGVEAAKQWQKEAEEWEAFLEAVEMEEKKMEEMKMKEMNENVQVKVKRRRFC